MSRQNRSNKIVTVTFLMLIVSMGVPFYAFPTFSLNQDFYDLEVVNLLLGNGLVGLPVSSLFESSPTAIKEPLPQAFAQVNDTYPITTRYDNYEDTQVTDTRHVAKLGLPTHIEDNQGDFVANLVYEDDDGIELESGTISYYFGKSSCAMSLFNAGRIDPTAVPLIKSDTWVTKVALNGTDSWSDVSQNDLPCVVTTDISSRAVTINSTKSDVNGTMTEIYHYDIYKGMKSTVYFTNNDSSLNNHKFSFSNILLDTPQNVNFLSSPNRVGVPYVDPITNSSIKMNYYSMYDSEFQPFSFAGSDVEKIGDGNSTQTITVERDDMFDIINFNGTDYYEKVFGGFYWIEDQGVDQARSFAYSFEDEDDFEKLWAVKFVTHSDFTMDTYIDYANVTATLPVGQTTMIDPTIDTFDNFESFTVSIGSSGQCNSGTSFSKSPTGFGISISISISGGKPATCGAPVMIFDITGIPDDATPVRGTLQINHTSYGCSTGSIFTICHTFYQDNTNFYDCSGEDITVLPDILLKQAIFGGGAGTICGADGTGAVHFGLGRWHQFIGIRDQSKTLVLDPFIIDFEDRLESGSPRYNIVASTGSGSAASPIGGVGGGSRSGSAGSGWSTEGSFLEVEYDFFSTPSEPINVTCSADTPTTVLIDWDNPLADGGRPIDFFNIERDSGGGFTDLIQVPIFPTSFVDTTVIAGVGFTYRVAAENGEGEGIFSLVTESCGVVGQSDPPTNLTAQNQALGVVALDWDAPLFNGNDPIEAYKIQRTSGTPSTDNEWSVVNHRRDLTPPAEQHNSGGVTTLPDLISLNCIGGIGNCEIFKTFLTEDLKDRSITMNFQQNQNGFFAGDTDEWGSSWYIVDGSLDKVGANIQNSGGIFEANVAGTAPRGQFIPPIGNGIIVDCYVTDLGLGGGGADPPITTTGGSVHLRAIPNVSYLQGSHGNLVVPTAPTPETCKVGDLSGASQDTVTMVFVATDNSFSGVVGVGTLKIESINIDGIGLWDFSSTLPLDTEIILQSDLGTTGTDIIFNQVPVGASFPLNDVNKRLGTEVDIGSSGIGQTFNKLTTSMSRVSTATGTFNFIVYNSVDTILATSSDFDISTIALDPTFTTVSLELDNPVTLSVGDKILMVYTDGTATEFINIKYNNVVATQPAGFLQVVHDGVSYQANNNHNVNLQFDADPINLIDNIVARIIVNNFTIGDGFQDIVSDTGNTNVEFLDNTVEELTNYGYRVFALNSVEDSDASNVAVIFTAGAPFAPVITATPTGTQTITVDWDEPNLSGGSLVGYEVDRKLGTGGIFSQIDIVTESIINDGEGLFALQSATEYCYRVKTLTNVGDSTFSIESCATTFDSPTAVENLQVTALDGSSVDMSFDPPLSDGGSALTGFKIERQIGGGGFITLDELTFDQSRSDTGLPVGTLIEYRVSASNQFGFGLTDTEGDTTDATPQAPPNFTCSASSASSITLNWDTPLTFSAPTGYLIDRKEVGGSFSTIEADTADTATIFADQGLVVDSIFVYRILGHTTEGDTDFTPEITCTTLSAPDFPPEDLQGDFTPTVPHQMILAWDIPDTFGVPITSFRVERDDGSGYNEIASVSGSTFLYVDQEPANAVSQKYRVFTVGSEGDSAPSIAIPFSANQISHWSYEKSVDDTGDKKNFGLLTGTPNFNNTGQIGLGFLFDGSTYITVANEADYDFDDDSFGITTYYRGNSTGLDQIIISKSLPFNNQELSVWGTNADQSIEDFSTYTDQTDVDLSWIPLDTVIDGDTVADNLNIAFTTTAPQNYYNTFYDLGQTISNSTFTSRFALDSTAITLPTNFHYQIHFGLSDSGSTDCSGASQDFLGLTLRVDSATSTWQVQSNDGTTLFETGTDVFATAPTTAGIQYFELVRTSSTTFEVNLYSDSSYTTLTETQSKTIPSTISGLDSWKVCTFDNAGTATGAYSATVDDIQIFNGLVLADDGLGYTLFIDDTGVLGIRLTKTSSSNEIAILGNTVLTDDNLHFLGMGYNGNQTASGISLMVDGVFETKNVINDNLSTSILNDEPLTIGASSLGTDTLTGLLDDTRFFGSGTLDDETLQAVADNSITTVIPINATFVISGTTFADISRETPVIIMTSGYPIPTVDTIDLFNFTATNVNSLTPNVVIDSETGIFVLDPEFFNVMGSLSNYTAEGSLTNSEEVALLFSNFDLQTPLFTFTGDFFFQQERNPTFDILSFNYTQTVIPFDLACNFKSTLFDNGTTVFFNDVFFVQLLQPVPQLEDVVVACIDQNSVVVDPSAPSFGGTNTILSFVSFGDTSGVGNFLQFTNNYGDFFGVGLPFLFVIILAAAFTGRSAPTGILIIAVALGIMVAMGILEIDPFMWGIILVLVILGILGGKKFL